MLVLLLGGLVLFGLLAVAATGFQRRRIDLPLSGGWLAETHLPSFWASLRGSRSSTILKSARGVGGAIDLLHSMSESPIVMFTSTNHDLLYCLYEFDVDLRLLKFDTARGFEPTPGGPLATIVCRSRWKVTEGDSNDWAIAECYLKRIPADEWNRQSVPSVDLGVLSVHRSRKVLLQRIQQQVSIMFGSVHQSR